MTTAFRFTPQNVRLTRTLNANDPEQRALSNEHGALLRQMAALQLRVSDQIAQQTARLVVVESENLRLRAELVRSRTAALWGLQAATVAAPVRRREPRSLAPVVRQWREAQAVICQTGCVGHAHAWLDDQGQCRRTGEVCQPHGSDSVDRDLSRQAEEPGAD